AREAGRDRRRFSAPPGRRRSRAVRTGLNASGLFAAAVEPPAGADDLTRLLCLLGRRP
ncbi:TIGR03086 family metal-binding protein, partial [Streptomyces decoyicus]